MIKYRVWDTKQNKYLHPDTVSISGSGAMSFAGTGGKYHTITQPSDDPSPRFIIEQYIGMKDKNGMAIYEGDIVQLASRIRTYRRHVTGVDEWGCFVLTSEGNIPYNFKEMDRMGIGKFEVIGNIHEH